MFLINSQADFQLSYMPILVGFARGITRSNPPNEGRAPVLTLSAVKLFSGVLSRCGRISTPFTGRNL